ncbi:transporter substrate-binding domain-containing protein [Pigmentibacter sp. JX0631]|uniref:substrate-binding periplasmic protein n=1 Tax=Pigmentibacter sp. JX0631 TaxID=2976982 RepID=UPI0024687A77|nr:transporter substrate-binding domain-containing protein [Pigmentibacter sp. JX0631]WGL60957.1 transporter substrate-binding domain-containing protein [Pigmentibacter sp. JX0631]
MKIIYCILIFIFSSVFASEAEKSVHIGRIMYTQNQILGSLILTDIYEQAKIPFEFIDLPGYRVTEELKNGNICAEVFRPFSYGEDYPYFIRISQPINYMQLKAYALKRKNIKIQNWESLKNHTIGIIKGSVLVEKKTSEVKDKILVNTIEQLIEMLIKQRVDLFITDEFNAKIEIRKSEHAKLIEELNPALTEKIPLYHYFNNKCKNISEVIEKKVKELVQGKKLENIIENNRKKMLKN